MADVGRHQARQPPLRRQIAFLLGRILPVIDFLFRQRLYQRPQFDPAGLAQVGGVKLETLERSARTVETPIAVNSSEVPVLLFRGLDGARRALRLGVVDRIEEVDAEESIRHSAGQLRVQLGEAILPLAGVDKSDALEGKVRVFRLNDGSHEIGYAFREVIDLKSLDRDVIPADAPGDVGGVTLIDGEPAAVDHPGEPDLDAVGDEERTLLEPRGRETHVGQRDAPGQRVVAQTACVEYELVTGDELRRPREGTRAGPGGVDGEQRRQ